MSEYIMELVYGRYGVPSYHIVQELIRGEDCKHYNDGDCTELPKLVGDDDFCSFGEKKEDE